MGLIDFALSEGWVLFGASSVPVSDIPLLDPSLIFADALYSSVCPKVSVYILDIRSFGSYLGSVGIYGSIISG